MRQASLPAPSRRKRSTRPRCSGSRCCWGEGSWNAEVTFAFVVRELVLLDHRPPPGLTAGGSLCLIYAGTSNHFGVGPVAVCARQDGVLDSTRERGSRGHSGVTAAKLGRMWHVVQVPHAIVGGWSVDVPASEASFRIGDVVPRVCVHREDEAAAKTHVVGGEAGARADVGALVAQAAQLAWRVGRTTLDGRSVPERFSCDARRGAECVTATVRSMIHGAVEGGVELNSFLHRDKRHESMASRPRSTPLGRHGRLGKVKTREEWKSMPAPRGEPGCDRTGCGRRRNRAR